MKSNLSPNSADALLFDLGRVVLDIDFGQALAIWAGHAGCQPADLAARFVRDEAYRHHEIGKIGMPSISRACATRSASPHRRPVLEGWNAIFVGEMPDIAPLLARAARRMPLYAFSNTNRPHVEYFSKAYADVLGHFHEISCHRQSGFGNRCGRL